MSLHSDLEMYVRVKQFTCLTFVLVILSDTLLLLAQEFKEI